MSDPAELDPRAVSIPEPELRDAVVLKDVTDTAQQVLCVIPSHDPLLKSDPMPWNPVFKASPKGLCFPKKGDRAVVGRLSDGPPVVLEWWPQDSAAPDIPLS